MIKLIFIIFCSFTFSNQCLNVSFNISDLENEKLTSFFWKFLDESDIDQTRKSFFKANETIVNFFICLPVKRYPQCTESEIIELIKNLILVNKLESLYNAVKVIKQQLLKSQDQIK